MENLIKRFVKYAKVHTTSNEDSETVPSTEIQKNLGKILVEDLKEIMSSKKECDYINYDNPPKIMNMLKKNTNNFIKENSDYGYVNALDVSKLSDSFVDSTTYYNYEKITSFINGVIYDEVEKMVSGSLAGDNDEDLCKMRNLKVLLDTGTQVYNKSGGTTLARYDEEINSIID